MFVFKHIPLSRARRQEKTAAARDHDGPFRKNVAKMLDANANL